MAILNGIISKISGSAGNLSFSRTGGQTVIRERVTHIRNPRSNAQMQTRTKWGNIIAMYKGIRPLLNYGFENKPKNLSDYNMFVKWRCLRGCSISVHPGFSPCHRPLRHGQRHQDRHLPR